MSSATCQFPTLRDAVETVIAVMQTGIPVARMELLDEVQMAACISYSKLQGLEALPSLFFEFHGTAAGVAEEASQAPILHVPRECAHCLQAISSSASCSWRN
jgi:D-lactate dehydrogenase (cytochrome)